MLTVGSLFSGIGGLEKGLEDTGGFRTVWQCENDAYASAVLRKHWPETPNFGDITKVDWHEVGRKHGRPDLVCGGFPCQDISNAGKKAGITGKRSGLWKEFHRAIKGTRPGWVIIENVGVLTSRGLDVILADLRSAGYTPFRPILIEAASVGAPHHRERLFIVGYSNNYGQPPAEKREGVAQGSDDSTKRQEPASELERPGIEREVMADADFERKQQPKRIIENVGGRTRDGGEDVADSESFLLQGLCSQPGQEQSWRSSWWEIEPDVGRVAHGVPSRVDRIKCLGNAVVPACAQVIGEAILEVDKSLSVG